MSNPSPCFADDLPTAGTRGRLSARVRDRRVTAFSLPAATLAFLAVPAIALIIVWRLSRRHGSRERAYTRLLDAADALEARLRVARTEIEAMTGGEDETVLTALQEMLRQRLWLREHGATAPVKQLDAMRASIDQARDRIDQQLTLVQRARGSAPDA